MAELNKILWNECGLNAKWIGDRCPKLVQLHESVSFMAEYGVNWHEFVNTDYRVDGIVQKWWNALPAEEQLVYLLQYQELLASGLARVNEAVSKVRA